MRVIVLRHFKKQLKPLVKKHRTLKDSVIAELHAFNIHRGVSISRDVYKLRFIPSPTNASAITNRMISSETQEIRRGITSYVEE